METAVPVEPSSATVVMVATVVPAVLAALVVRDSTAWGQTEGTVVTVVPVVRAERVVRRRLASPVMVATAVHLVSVALAEPEELQATVATVA